MPFVARSEAGQIQAVFGEQHDDAREQLACDSPELAAFLEQRLGGAARERLAASDIDMARLLEDLIDLMMRKNMVSWEDFTPSAQRKLLMRKDLRWRMQNHA